MTWHKGRIAYYVTEIHQEKNQKYEFSQKKCYAPFRAVFDQVLKRIFCERAPPLMKK